MKTCIKCNGEIHPQRLKILPKTNVCVKCANVDKYRGTPVQLGEGDHTYDELLIQGKYENKWA